MEHVYQCLVDKQFFWVTNGISLLSLTTLQAEEKRNYWYGVLFLILEVAIFESLEWCEHPVCLRAATNLSGVIMGDVWGETTPVSELLCKLEARAKQSPEIETRMAAAAKGMKEETNIVLKTRKDHCDYLIWPLVLHKPQNIAQWLLQFYRSGFGLFLIKMILNFKMISTSWAWSDEGLAVLPKGVMFSKDDSISSVSSGYFESSHHFCCSSCVCYYQLLFHCVSQSRLLEQSHTWFWICSGLRTSTCLTESKDGLSVVVAHLKLLLSQSEIHPI